MLIQNLIYRKPQNARQDAGDLDGQILADLEGLRQKLLDYQEEHLDRKVKGRSNHYGQWTEENQKKLAWLERLITAFRNGIGTGPAQIPERIEKGQWDAMHPKIRDAAVLAIAIRETSRIRPYLPETVYAEKQSFHPDDWYLWSVAACRDSAEGRVWDCWTLNLTTGGMNGGRYGLSCEGLRKALASKKGVEECRPEKCGRLQEKDKEESPYG